MTGLDLLKMVFALLPVAFLADLLIFTFAVWWIRRWRRARS